MSPRIRADFANLFTISKSCFTQTGSLPYLEQFIVGLDTSLFHPAILAHNSKLNKTLFVGGIQTSHDEQNFKFSTSLSYEALNPSLRIGDVIPSPFFSIPCFVVISCLFEGVGLEAHLQNFGLWVSFTDFTNVQPKAWVYVTFNSYLSSKNSFNTFWLVSSIKNFFSFSVSSHTPKLLM